jgi:hypothetical protein
MTQTPTLPTPADLAAPPPTYPENCLCAAPSAAGCQLLRRVAALWWGNPEPEEEVCPCLCHTNGAWER